MDNQTDNSGPQSGGTPDMPRLRTLDLTAFADAAEVEGEDDATDEIAPEAAAPSESETKTTVGAATVPSGTFEKLSSKRTLTVSELDQLVELSDGEEFIVEGMLPAESVAIACGESTIGKSPLFYMLGLCIAAGHDFLGMKVAHGKVLYVDLENPKIDSRNLRQRLVSFLGIEEELPDDFFQVSLQQVDEKIIGGFILEVEPILVVIDSLRSFSPSTSAKNEKAGEILKMLKTLARKYHVTFLVLHHPKKTQNQDDGSVLDLKLENVSVEQWMQQMEGARALVNQTDVRIAIEAGDENPAALKIKWNRRVHGDSPLMHVERTLDEEGDPLGYRKLQGKDFLSKDDRTVFDRLAKNFTYSDAARAFDTKSGSVPTRFIKACIAQGLIKRLSATRGYRKTTE